MSTICNTELMTSTGTSFTANTVKWPLNIIFDNCGSLKPTEDITPREAVFIQMMLACALGGGGMIDYAGFVKDHGLERHFKND